MKTQVLVLGLLTAAVAFGQTKGLTKAHPRDGEIKDTDTRAWWHTTEDLSSDAMEGRDTGSAGYARAAQYVADRFKAAGLLPAGGGGYLQQVPLHEVEVTREGTSFTLVRAGAPGKSLRFQEEIDITPGVGLPARLEGALAFRGYCGKDQAKDLTGKIAVCFAARRAGLPSARERIAAVREAGAVAMINLDDVGFTLEPPRWPNAYTRSVTIQGGAARGAATGSFVTMRLGEAGFRVMLEGSGQSAQELLAAGVAARPLPSFDLGKSLQVTTHTEQKEYSSPNVLAMLPGTDPVLKSEYVVIAAHLDGYGHGTPVLGDSLYNGALDDAAYVALLIQFAENQKAQAGGLKRSVLFCAFTGEEKGLLGSNWFTQHPTVAKEKLVADINLDQLRPLFPLNILTALAVDDTTLGAIARKVGAPMGIEIRADREPERGLLTRADHWPFMQIGVPSIGFIFGYDPGTEAEKRYRQWYRTQYHRPQDDLTQPMDFDAATKFNTFFYTLTRTLANDTARPAWVAGSKYAPAIK